MSIDEGSNSSHKQQIVLPNDPPFIWPEPRWYAGQGIYESQPPCEPIFADANLISGVLVGTADQTLEWLNTQLQREAPPEITLVVIVYPAGPTREEHLHKLKLFQDEISGADRKLNVRVLPVSRAFGQDFEKMILPPSIVQAHDTRSSKTWLCIGSVGDCGRDESVLCSFNMVFQPADGLRDHFRRWFQYLFSSAAPLTEETVRVPHLIPAEGDPDAARLWTEFEISCWLSDVNQNAKPAVDQKTGEVTAESDGGKVTPWDGGKTKLDPIGQMLQQVYARGLLVTVDETTRIKPLSIPVKATLLGEHSERIVGALTHRQSFNL